MKRHRKNCNNQQEAKLLRFREKRNFLVSFASKRKAQIKMGETIAILFIFFVLILFGLIFYFQWQKSSFERQQLEVFSEQSISKSLLASFLPELVCSRAGGIVIKDCVDLMKLEYAMEEMDEIYYYDIFGFATIYVEEIYPGDGVWVLYNQTPVQMTKKVETPMPVSLYEPISGDFSYGVLYVQVYK